MQEIYFPDDWGIQLDFFFQPPMQKFPHQDLRNETWKQQTKRCTKRGDFSSTTGFPGLDVYFCSKNRVVDLVRFIKPPNPGLTNIYIDPRYHLWRIVSQNV